PDFGRLQHRMGLSRARDVERERGRTPVHLMVFDVLEEGEDSLLRVPYSDRRQRLSDHVSEGESIHVPEAFDGDIDDAMESSKKLGLEGVMAKRRDSIYLPGRRTQTWVKLKHAMTRDVIIVGWRTGTGERSPTFASLLLAAPEGSELVYLGRVGTRCDEPALTSPRRKLNRLSRRTPPLPVPAAESRDAQWVRPPRLGEVHFSAETEARRLRHPVWRGLRDEIDP